MTYDRKKFPAQGNALAWVFLLLAALLGFLLWAETREDTADLASIIPRPAAANNTQTEKPESTGKNADLTCPGVTLYGVQSASFSTREAAEATGLAVWAEGDAYRALRSVWLSREDALAQAEETDYVAKLVIPALNLHLSGKEEDIAAVESALKAWEAVLREAAELQSCREKLSPETREAWRLRLEDALTAARDGLPQGEATDDLREALAAAREALDGEEDLSQALARLYADFAQYGAGLVD